MTRTLLWTSGVLLCGCSLIAPIRDHTFDLVDAGTSADAGVADAAPDAASPCPEICSGLTPVCDAINERCVRCLTATDCDDGRACTVDRCNLDNTCTSTLDTGCVAQITVAGSHSCARFALGTVRCWGNNQSGQLGNGTNEPATLPVGVLGINDAIDVDAGGAFTCAVRSSGAVNCWGAGLAGQLGYGMSVSSPQPVVVMGVTDAVRVTAGRVHACALRAGGQVVCWGGGVAGQLGDGTMGTGHASNVATPVMGLTGATAIAAGSDHTCALLGNGTLVCWGENTGNELGDGTMMNKSTPVPVLDLIDAVQITDHCARRVGNTLACWGLNDWGQIGDTTTEPSDRPVMVANLTEVIDLASSNDVACAIRQTGETLCWGRNDEGQLGINEMGLGTERAVPTTVMSLPDALHIAVSRRHACAVRAAGQVVCWGANDMSQVSYTGVAFHLVPVAVEGF